MSQKTYLIDFYRFLHEFFTGFEKKYFNSLSDLKTASLNLPDTYETPCSTKSLLRLPGFLFTRLFFQSLKKPSKQRTRCTN